MWLDKNHREVLTPLESFNPRNYMKENFNRRNALKVAAVAAVGGLLGIKDVAAESFGGRPGLFLGNWIYAGQPCAIFQMGVVLLLVNEQGSLGTAFVTGSDSLLVKGGSGWDVGLTAVLSKRGNQINWSNETVWTRA
jgi:hypothetical protein